MKKDIRDRWVQALESDDFKQAEGSLHVKEDDEDSFCCLGVLCEIAVADGVIVRHEYDDDDPKLYFGYRSSDMNYDEFDVLPEVVVRWAELDDQMGGRLNFEYAGTRVSLVELNDTFHLNFKEIAAIIKDQL